MNKDDTKKVLIQKAAKAISEKSKNYKAHEKENKNE